MTKKIYNSAIYNSDKGYIPDECDDQITNTKIVLPPACFQKCVQCLKENPNPHFQCCYICYRVSSLCFICTNLNMYMLLVIYGTKCPFSLSSSY